MQTISPIDSALENQSLLRRRGALALIGQTKLPTMLALQVPVWFALLMAAFFIALPTPKLNPLPVVAGMLGCAILWGSVLVVRLNRRLDAVVQLITSE
jgi:hypothetical protein